MKLRHLFSLVGAGLFAWMLQRIGFATILTQLTLIGWWGVPLFFISASWTLCYAFGWRRILSRQRHMSLWVLYRIKLAGEAVSAITPANFIGGDPVRVYLLRRYFPWTHGAASVVIDRTLHSISILGMIVIGVTLAFWNIPHLPTNVQIGLPIVLFVVCGFVGFVFLHQRHGLFNFGMDLLRRLHIRRHFTPEFVKRCDELDRLVAEFYTHDPAGFWITLGYNCLGRCLGIVELYVIGRVVDPRFGWLEALVLGAVAPLINLIFTFIPGAFGVMEGAYGITLYLLALPASLGLTIQIIKRARAALWLALGFMVLGTHDRKALLHHSPAAK